MKSVPMFILGMMAAFFLLAIFIGSGTLGLRLAQESIGQDCEQLGGFSANGERYVCRNVKQIKPKGTAL